MSEERCKGQEVRREGSEDSYYLLPPLYCDPILQVQPTGSWWSVSRRVLFSHEVHVVWAVQIHLTTRLQGQLNS